MGLDIYVEIRFANEALWIDEKGVARGDFGDAEIDQRAVGRGDFIVGVGEQLEVETFLGTKLSVSAFVLDADTEDDGVFLFILSEVALEIVRFDGAAAGEILGVEIKHDPFAAKIAKTERFSILRIQREVGRGRSGTGRFFSAAQSAGGKDGYEQNDCNN